MEIIGYIVVFGSILFLAYFTTRFIGTKYDRSSTGKYISVIDTVNIGMDKQLMVLKVSEQFMLISVCGKNIEFLSEIKISGYDEQDQKSEKPGSMEFKGILEMCAKSLKGIPIKKDGMKKDTGMEVVSSSDSGKFFDNLSRLKKISMRPEEEEAKSHGDIF